MKLRSLMNANSFSAKALSSMKLVAKMRKTSNEQLRAASYLPAYKGTNKCRKKIEMFEKFGTDLGWFGGDFGTVWGYFRDGFGSILKSRKFEGPELKN